MVSDHLHLIYPRREPAWPNFGNGGLIADITDDDDPKRKPVKATEWRKRIKM